MEKENLCTLKSFMATGAEAFAQAQVGRAVLLTEPPWLKGPVVSARLSQSPQQHENTHQCAFSSLAFRASSE